MEKKARRDSNVIRMRCFSSGSLRVMTQRPLITMRPGAEAGILINTGVNIQLLVIFTNLLQAGLG